jgi:hypothetical protein
MLFVFNLLSNRLVTPEAQALGRAPVGDLLPDAGYAVSSLIDYATKTGEEKNLFKKLGDQLGNNLLRVSGIDPQRDSPEAAGKRILWPADAKDKSAGSLAQVYLTGTPLADLLTLELPFGIPLQSRFSHMHIVGGSGHGKTQTLQALMLPDIQRVAAGKGSLIVIDSQGDMLQNIEQLAILRDMPERVVIIDPTDDVAHPPALNLFDFGLSRVNQYDALARETLLTR